MNAYDKLKEEFEIQVEVLQKTCPHKKVSKWMDEWWAIGHSTGHQVRVCENCNKQVKRKPNDK
jgi:hypothetical protein